MFPNKDYTIHLEEHSGTRADCEFCDRLMWGEDNWSKKDLEAYAKAINRESGVAEAKHPMVQN